MPRGKEFDVDTATAQGLQVFWTKGYGATSTDDLREAMGIGRQSLYDTFGGKRFAFLAALELYTRDRFAEMQALLTSAPSPLAGIERMLLGLANQSRTGRLRGCLGVSSMGELGTSDVDAARINDAAQARVLAALTATITRGQELGEIPATVEPAAAAAQLHATFVGMRVIAKGGATPQMLRDIATSTLASLRHR